MGPKPYSTESKIYNVTIKITSGSAAGAGTSKGSTNGAGTAGFGAACAAAESGGRQSRLFMVSDNKRGWWRLFSSKKLKRPFHRSP